MDYKKLTAPCGKDCFNCPLYIGEENKENREAFLKRNNTTEHSKRFFTEYYTRRLNSMM